MSRAEPMNGLMRFGVYAARGPLTARQERQLKRMGALADYRESGALKPHGGTGERVRKPIARPSPPPLGGEVVGPYVAVWCPTRPCPVHGDRPRLHRVVRDEVTR